jgi:hypothetical protein
MLVHSWVWAGKTQAAATPWASPLGSLLCGSSVKTAEGLGKFLVDLLGSCAHS